MIGLAGAAGPGTTGNISDQMQLAALEAVDVDHVVSGADLGGLLATLAGSPAGPFLLAHDDLDLEVEIAAGA